MKAKTFALLALGLGAYLLYRKLEDAPIAPGVEPTNPIADPLELPLPPGTDPVIPLPPSYGHDVIGYEPTIMPVPLPVREVDPAWFKNQGIL